MDPEIIKTIVETKVLLEQLNANFTNHLAHHFRYSMFAWSVAIGMIVTLTVYIIKKKKGE